MQEPPESQPSAETIMVGHAGVHYYYAISLRCPQTSGEAGLLVISVTRALCRPSLKEPVAFGSVVAGGTLPPLTLFGLHSPSEMFRWGAVVKWAGAKQLCRAGLQADPHTGRILQ